MSESRYRFIRAAVAVAVFFAPAFAAAPASAQVCPYNSTQGTCACPTSGGGTTCFGGQLYRSTDSSCQNDTRPCASNQQFDCATAACACNTASFPCGGCTAATSTVGNTCGAPVNGKYTNVCGACACPAGTTLCGASNTCVTNLTCPAGTTFDPCTNTCGTPYVLLNPASTQSGAIKVDGNITTTTGNTFLGGDLYLPSGKAIRVDGTGVTSLSIGNWGGGGTGVNVNIPSGSQMCFGAACRASWPSTADFDPTYLNANGDTMTGTLNMTGPSTNLYVAGSVGIGTTSPTQKLDVAGTVHVLSPTTTTRVIVDRNATTNFATTSYATAGAIQWELGMVNTSTNDLNLQNFAGTNVLTVQQSSGNVGIGIGSPAFKLDVNGTAHMTGFNLNGGGAGKILTSDASGNGTWQTPSGVQGSGTVNYVPKFTAASTLGNSQIVDTGTNVGIGIASPAYKLDVFGTGNVWTGSSSPAFSGTNTSNGNGVYARSFSGTGLYATGDAGMAAWLSSNSAPAMRADAAYASNNDVQSVLGLHRSGPSGAGANGIGGSVDYYDAVVGGGQTLAGSVAGILTNANTSSLQGALTFSTANGGVNSEKVRIDVNGNVGVGTTNPGSYKLNVNGTGQIGNSSVTDGLDVQANLYGVSAQTWGNFANAIWANALNGGANNTGVNGMGSYIGVSGSTGASGGLAGVYGNSTGGYGVYGSSTNTYGVYGYTSAAAYGVYGAGTSALAGVYGTTNSSSGSGVTGYSASGYGGSFSSSSNTALAASSTNATYGAKISNGGTWGVYATSGNTAVAGVGTYYGVYGNSTSTSSTSIGVQGVANGPYGSGGDFKANATGGMGVSSSGASYSFYGFNGAIDNQGDLQLYSKTALRGNDSWLRLNQDGQFTSGTHTPHNFNAEGITTGGRYYDPGWGNLEVDGTITTNYYQSWWYADAYNGGQGGPTTTSAPISNTICVNIKDDVWGQWGGRCDIWDNGTYWVFGAYSYSNPGAVHCIWRCYKYR